MYDFPEISAKYCVCIYITSSEEIFYKLYHCFKEVRYPSAQKEESLRTTAALLDLAPIFLFVCIYDNAIRKSQIHIFRLPLQSFWSHFLAILYQHKLSVFDLILLNEQKGSVNLR